MIISMKGPLEEFSGINDTFGKDIVNQLFCLANKAFLNFHPVIDLKVHFNGYFNSFFNEFQLQN